MRRTWARTAPLLLVLTMALLSGCPDPGDDAPGITHKKPSPTPTVGGKIGSADPTAGPGASSSPGGTIDSTLKTPTPQPPDPTPTATLAPLDTPVPVVTQPTPSTTPKPIPSDPIGQH